MSKITEYTLSTRFDSNDVLLKDGSAGSKNLRRLLASRLNNERK